MPIKQAEKIAVSTFIGSGIGLFTSSILIFIMAAILAIGDIPAMLISPATVAVLAFGGFCGGYFSARFSGEKGILCGASSGIIYFAVIWISGGILGAGSFGIGMMIKAVMITISSSIGGIIGVNQKTR